MTIQMKNTSTYIGKEGRTDYWEWTIALYADKEEDLDDVLYVIYKLHPTFPSPVAKVTDRAGGFPLTRKGWGTFEVVAEIKFKSKRTTLFLRHELEFEDAE
jgi:transcription initiation factor IIF auxiliary subunit